MKVSVNFKKCGLKSTQNMHINTFNTKFCFKNQHFRVKQITKQSTIYDDIYKGVCHKPTTHLHVYIHQITLTYKQNHFTLSSYSSGYFWIMNGCSSVDEGRATSTNTSNTFVGFSLAQDRKRLLNTKVLFYLWHKRLYLTEVLSPF